MDFTVLKKLPWVLLVIIGFTVFPIYQVGRAIAFNNSQQPPGPELKNPEVSWAVQMDATKPLKDVKPVPPRELGEVEVEQGILPGRPGTSPDTIVEDPALQQTT